MIKSLRLRIVEALIPCFSLFFLASLFSEINAQNVTGKVFRDFDASGLQTTALPALIEPGVQGVTVKAFNAVGTQIGAAVQTALNGTYSLPVATTNQVRVEFSNLPTGFFSGPKGALSGTSVQFVNGGNTANLGINYPTDYCGINPLVVTPCYVNGNPVANGNTGQEPFIVGFPYNPGATSGKNKYLAKGFQVGATWGLAYQRQTQTFFTSAVLKRHSGFGTNGAGAIYQIKISATDTLTSLLVDLNTAFGINFGTNPRNFKKADSLFADKNTPNRDSTAFDLVGKMSFGDIDISDDGKTLWVMNLADRKLYELPIGIPATKPITFIAHTITNPGCNNGVFRPWAIKFWRGKVYVGGVCTAENSGGVATDLKAYVYVHDPEGAVSSFSEVINFPLTYPRGNVSLGVGNIVNAAWRPWIKNWSDINNPLPGGGPFSQTIYPQPILSNIEFDVEGSMIIGFIDRFGHQIGNKNYSTLVTDGSPRRTYEGVSGGDILRASLDNNGKYILENNASVGGVATAGKNNTQGPGNGEFYYQDNYKGSHDEITLGGLALLPGYNEVVTNVFDPVDAVRSGGVKWFNNTTGASNNAYQIFGTDEGGAAATFGKASGLGDVELACSLQPIQVGNRLWNDTNKNGIQDADEPALTGVTVQLFKNGVQVGANISTDAITGEFYFTGLIPNMTDYEIRIPNVKGASKQAKLAGLEVTTANVGANTKDLIDSDAIVSATNTYASIPFSTGNAGENLHALDAGFSCVVPVARPIGIVGDVKICEPTALFTLPAAKTGADAETWKVLTSPANPAATITSTGLVNGMITNGKYTFVLTNDNTGCADTVSIIRNPMPMAGADQAICFPFKTAKLTAKITGQVWTIISQPSGGLATITPTDSIINMNIDGVYTLRISNGVCFDEVQITRKAKPNAGNDITVCSSTITTANLGIATGTDTWGIVTTPANPAVATVGDKSGAVLGITADGIYRFYLTSDGCTDTVSVSKGAAISVTAENYSICLGGNLSLLATAIPSTGVTYVWSGPSGFTSNQQNPVIANITNNNIGVYTVTVTAGTCSASATSKAELNKITVALIGGFTNVCVGQNLNLKDVADRQPNEPKPQTYFWSGPNNFTANTPTTGNIMTTDGAKEIGEYSLTETYPDGCVITVKLTPTANRCLSLGNLVWNDADNDGLNNNGEMGIGNVPVRLYYAKVDSSGFEPVPSNIPRGGVIQSTITDPMTGKYLFQNLIPGSYLVEIDAPTGYKTSTGKNGFAIGPFEPATMANDTINDNDDGTKLLSQTIRTSFVTINNFTGPITDGDKDRNTNLTIDFGIFKPASIGNFVWADINKDGFQDAGELGVANVIVKLYAGTSTTALANFTTLSDGKYLFDNLTPGTYTVEFVKTSIGASNSFSPLAGVGSTQANDSNADPVTGKSTPIILTAGEFNETIDAGIIVNCTGSTVGTITVPNLCVGSSLTMKATSTDLNAKYVWTTSAATPFSATTQEVTLNGLTTLNSGIYTVTITNSNLCTSALTANVLVNPLPTVTATNAEFCEGKTGTITASGATTYSWSGPNPFVTTSSNPLIVSKSGIYTVTGTLNGCSAMATAIVKVNLNPVLTATGATICLGGSGTVSVLPAGLASYAWSGPNPFITTQQTATITNATNAYKGTYTVAVMDNKTCYSSATVVVSVGAALIVTPTSTSPVCAGTRLELSVIGGTGSAYLWTSPNGVTSSLANPFTNNATAADNGTWTVTVTSSDACKGTGSTNVVINPAVSDFSVIPIQATCTTGVANADAKLSIAGLDITNRYDFTEGISYIGTKTFTSASSITDPTITVILANPAADKSYTVRVFNVNGCYKDKIVTLKTRVCECKPDVCIPYSFKKTK